MDNNNNNNNARIALLDAMVQREKAETTLFNEMVEAANMIATVGLVLAGDRRDDKAAYVQRMRHWRHVYYAKRDALDKLRREPVQS